MISIFKEHKIILILTICMILLSIFAFYVPCIVIKPYQVHQFSVAVKEINIIWKVGIAFWIHLLILIRFFYYDKDKLLILLFFTVLWSFGIFILMNLIFPIPFTF